MTSPTQRSAEHRDTRLNIRLTTAQAELIRRAAESTTQTVTDFVLSSTSAAAERVLADRRWFVLDDEAWAEFEALLERPVVYKPRLSESLNAADPFVD